MPVGGNLACTRLALESLIANTDDPAYEVLMVDNGARKEIREYLEVLAARNRHLHVLHNEKNIGFAAACNQGLARAEGEQLVVLTNDTIVSPGWLAGLATHLRDPEIGFVVPTTNCAGGNAQVPAETGPRGDAGVCAPAQARARGRCAARLRPPGDLLRRVRRDVWREVGSFDGRLNAGELENDYSDRVRVGGYRVVRADDLFVHRFGGGFGNERPADSEPQAVALRTEEGIKRHLPEGSTVLVVSSAEDGLTDVDGYEVWRFPQNDGDETGNPNDEEAIAELERLRTQGADYLVVPAAERPWLERHEEFRRHLERFATPGDDPDTAIICDLGESTDAQAEEGRES